MGRIDSITADLMALSQSRPGYEEDLRPTDETQASNVSNATPEPVEKERGEPEASRSPFSDFDSPSAWGDRSRQLLMREHAAHIQAHELHQAHLWARARDRDAAMDLPYYRWADYNI